MSELVTKPIAGGDTGGFREELNPPYDDVTAISDTTPNQLGPAANLPAPLGLFPPIDDPEFGQSRRS
jgi:hypothetical protein